MKTRNLIAALGLLVAVAACGPKAPRTLVLYYSQTDNTEKVAQFMAEKTGADIEKIVAVNPYNGTYQETIARCLEEREKDILPEIYPVKVDISSYDVIFLGYPVWFGTMALPVKAFLKETSLAGKKVVPFCTFGSGGLYSSMSDMKEMRPEAEILPGYGVRAARMNAMPAEVDEFLKAGGFIKGEYTPLPEFGEVHPVTKEEDALFHAAVDSYPMFSLDALSAASRAVPEGTEYLFTATDRKMKDVLVEAPAEMKVYVLAEEGKDPMFTQIVRMN